jgi:hypothetical protein
MVRWGGGGGGAFHVSSKRTPSISDCQLKAQMQKLWKSG